MLARPLCHFFGYFYPAYQSYKAVKANDPALHTQWLTFWIVSTYFSFVESFGDTLLSWLPFYYEAKVAVLVWLVAPYFKGATKIYERVLDPYLHRYEKDIDANLDQVKRRSAREIGNLSRLGIEHLRAHSTEFLKLGQNVLLRQLANEENLLTSSQPQHHEVGQKTNTRTTVRTSTSSTRATIVTLGSDIDENELIDEIDADLDMSSKSLPKIPGRDDDGMEVHGDDEDPFDSDYSD